jgi:hypothetical protein
MTDAPGVHRPRHPMGVRHDRRTRSDAFGPESGRRTVRRTLRPSDEVLTNASTVQYGSRETRAMHDLTLEIGPEMPYARRRSYGRPRSEGRAGGRVGSDDHASWYRGSEAQATTRGGCRRERPRDALRSWRREPEPSDRPGSESRPNTMEAWSEVARNVELSLPAPTTDRTNSEAATRSSLERPGTGSTDRPSGPMPARAGRGRHSTVTLFARLRGLSIGRSRSRAV